MPLPKPIPVIKKPTPSVSTKPNTTKRSMAFVLILLLCGVAIVAYQKRNDLQQYYTHHFSKSDQTKPDSAQTNTSANDEDVPPLEEPASTTNPNQSIAASTIVNETANSTILSGDNSSTPIESIDEVTEQLDNLSNLPNNQHYRVFEVARQKYQLLKKQNPNTLQVARLYEWCAEQGTSAWNTYQQNSDEVLRQHALWWYQLAYVLNPSAEMGERMAQVEKRSIAKTTQPKLIKPSKPNPSVSFEPDPELKTRKQR